MRPPNLHGKTLPGIAAIVVMAVAVLLAYGVTGEPASKTYIDAKLQEQLRKDQQLSIITDPSEPAPSAQSMYRRPRSLPVDFDKPLVRDFRKAAYAAARKAHIRQPILFVRQMAAESGFQPCARSGAGALGIAQIMPSTAASWHVDPFDPDQALLVAAKKMRSYERHYGSYRVALAAYNAGPGAVASAGGVPAYAETRSYISRVTNVKAPLPGMHQVYRQPPRLSQKFAKQLRRLQRGVRRRGGRLVISEGWRSYNEQMRIWRIAKKRYGGWHGARKWVAPPGCSNHNRGLAADLAGSLGIAHYLAPHFGLVFPMSHENWHIEPQGISTQSG